jgi:hypothetical protein
LVDAERYHVVGVLIGHEKKRARRIDGEITRPFATRRFVRDEVQLARALINRERDDAVMAAVRPVNEPARRVDVDVGAKVRPAEIRRQCRNGLRLRQRSLGFIISERDQRRIEFVDDVGEFARRMKIEMARPRAGLRRGETVLDQLPILRVDAVDHHLVNSEVRRECEPPRRVRRYAMSVRLALPLRVGALARMLRHVGRLAQEPAGENRVDHDVAPAVIGRQNESARRMYRDVTGHSRRMPLIELAQIAGLLINRERGHAAAFLPGEGAAFVGGVKKPPLRINGEKRRVRDPFDRHGVFQFPAVRVHSININALALAVRVCTDVEEQTVSFFRPVLSGGRNRMRERRRARNFDELASRELI